MSAVLSQEPLSKDEQALFDAMRDDKVPAAKGEAKPDDAAAKALAEKAAKDAADKAAKDAAEKTAKDEAGKRADGNLGAALKEAREQNKALHKELDGLKSLVAAGDTKLAKFMDAVSKKAGAAAPKFEDDPAGALKAKNEQLEKDLQEVKDRLSKQDTAAKGANDLQAHAAKVISAEREFAKANPDYWQAAEFVAAAWRDELVEMGFEDEKVPELAFQKSIGLTNKAIASGRDPAEAIWKIAQRLGFKPKAAETAKEAMKDEKKEEKSEGEKKLETLQKGQDAAKVNGGARGAEELTLATLAQMDDDQIERLVADQDWWGKNVRRSPLH